MIRRVRPRPGLSLTEVLVAMFIMAVGMIAIFTLFPLGAMQVGQALRDDRTSQTAQQADGYIRDLWRNHVVYPLAAGGEPTEPFYWAMNDPNQWSDPPPLTSYVGPNIGRTPKLLRSGNVYGNSFLSPSTLQLPNTNAAPNTTNGAVISSTMLTQDTRTTTPADTPRSTTDGDPKRNIDYFNATFNPYPQGPTYPVLIDPIGFAARSGQDQAWAARTAAATGGNRILLPRRQLSAVFTNSTISQQNFSFQLAGMTDDVLFRPEGRPPMGAAEAVGTTSDTTMTRQGRYSWAAVIQRPDARRKDVADLTILTFDGRSRLPAVTAFNAATPQTWASNDEFVTVPLNTANRFTRSVDIQMPERGSDDPVLIRRGGWVMDGTIDNATGVRRAVFYRITGIVETPGPTGFVNMTLDLETPLQDQLNPTPGASTDPPASQLYFFAGLAEVFVRPQLRPDFDY